MIILFFAKTNVQTLDHCCDGFYCLNFFYWQSINWINSSFNSSIVVIPDGETRRIETFPVFCVTMIFSVFAYIWLLIILVVHSPDKVEVWEAAVTLAFIPVVVFASWCVF